MFSLLLFYQLYLVAYAAPNNYRLWINGVEVTDPVEIAKFLQRYQQSKPAVPTGAEQAASDEVTQQPVIPEAAQSTQSTAPANESARFAAENVAKLLDSSAVEGAVTLSDSVKAFIVDEHNRYRRMIANGEVPDMPAATVMNELMWSDAIGTKASEYASQCMMTHSPSGRYCGIDGYDNIGENLAASTTSTDGLSSDEQIVAAFRDAFKMWFDEYAYYNFSTRACAKQCGHFTQMVRDSTERIGCGIAMCESGIENFMSGQAGYMIVCNYGPGNNFSNKPAYETAAGQECPPVRPVREDGLCTGEGRRGPEVCVDQTSYCSVWKEEGKCEVCNNPYYQWMIETCPVTCGICE